MRFKPVLRHKNERYDWRGIFQSSSSFFPVAWLLHRWEESGPFFWLERLLSAELFVLLLDLRTGPYGRELWLGHFRYAKLGGNLSSSVRKRGQHHSALSQLVLRFYARKLLLIGHTIPILAQNGARCCYR